jgi:UDP-N-acetylmuramoylalanine--D-glutamate ligase
MKQQISIGGYIQNNNMKIITHTENSEMSVNDFALKGKHNQYNTMAAGIAASSIGVRKEKIREAVTTFQSLEHRMENIISIRGVQFINDSKATNINSTWYALESMERPTILILGGVDKGNDYNLIKDLVKEKVKAIVCLGKDNIKIHKAFSNIVSTIIDTESAEAAAHEAFRLSKKGDTVLLSPACASFDLFKNYEDRGRQFKKAVKEL